MYMDPINQTGEDNFNTEAYLAGQYEGAVKNKLEDLNPNNEERRVRMEDGIFLPRYRLPTEAEWEFAALGLIGNMRAPERLFSQRIYPWNGHYVRMDGRMDGKPKDIGKIRANFVRGRGDYMGMAGALNDGRDIVSPVYAYWPNDYGLYNMAGNVNEWVMDVYRQLTSQDADEFRPFRGNVFMTQVRDEEGAIAEKDSLGHIRWREVTDEEAFGRYNYRTADNINYLDGDYASSIDYDNPDADKSNKTSDRTYFTGKKGTDGKPKKYGQGYIGRIDAQSMVTNRSRVYKGGSWKDRAYWLQPGARRYLEEDQARDDLGFRCAMHRVGSPVQGTK